MSYRIAAADEYLAITGMSVKTVKITKSAWVWPFQRCARFSVQPVDYALDLRAMTREKLQFALPVIFTIGPDVNARGANSAHSRFDADNDDPATTGGMGLAHEAGVDGAQRLAPIRREDKGDALMKYAMLLADHNDGKQNLRTHVESIVKATIEGEVRVIVSAMTMEEIFTEREVFRRRIFRNIQEELSQFGLKIYNANIKELKDAPQSSYFESLSRKAHEGATNQARIDVAEAQLRGNVGEARRKGEQDREMAKIQAETAVQKTERDIERAQAEAKLNTRQTGLQNEVDLAQVTAKRALESRNEDLKKEVELKRAAAELERLRAEDVVRATIAREASQQKSDAEAYAVEANARADQMRAQKLADGRAYQTRLEAEASNFATLQAAEADVSKKIKEAEGITAMADAYLKLSQAFGGPSGLLQYMMIEKGTFVQLAKANATAIQGLQPKISVWTTGKDGEGSGGSDKGVDTMRNVYQMLPPLMTTINEQTGITLPEWQFGKLGAGVKAVNGEVNSHRG